MQNKIRVLVVDDSPLFRTLISDLLSNDPSIDVVGCAEDPYEARNMIKRLHPDVLTLDVEMPKMNGIQFLKNLMRLRPMPVVMVSTLTKHGATTTLKALEHGAIDYVTKPIIGNKVDLARCEKQIIEKVKAAATVNVNAMSAIESVARERSKVVMHPNSRVAVSNKVRVVAIGASTGGTEAVRHVLEVLPQNFPPIVITQHISAMFSAAFAERLNSSSVLNVVQLGDKPELLERGKAIVAPGDQHLTVYDRHGKLYAELDDSAPVNRHKPSVDVMFHSVTNAVQGKCLAALLTGMGRDGAEGMLRMSQRGAMTIAQDERTSVVWGMPKAAVELNAATYIKPLNDIGSTMIELVSAPSSIPKHTTLKEA